jgi:DNA gyrase subunit B
MTKLHAGGKFEKSAYKVSGGLHGVGVSVVNALSEFLVVSVKRDGNIYTQAFKRGKPLSDVFVRPDSNDTGTTVIFKPDPEIFPDSRFSFETLSTRLRELAFLNKGLEITIEDEREQKKHVFKYDGGIVTFVEYLNQSKTPLHPPIYFQGHKNGVEVEVCVQYNDSYTENVHSFANNINTVDGSTHLSGFKSALTRAFNKYIEKANPNVRVQSEDTREGLIAVISIKVPEPQFEGQTKAKLGNSEVKGIVDSLVHESIT